jgi:hypothetical protein
LKIAVFKNGGKNGSLPFSMRKLSGRKVAVQSTMFDRQNRLKSWEGGEGGRRGEEVREREGKERSGKRG